MTGPSSRPEHAEIHIRAVRGWPRERSSEPPHVVFTASEKAELARLAQIIDFRTTGSTIFAQGDDAAFIYLLADGAVRTCHTLRNGERQVLAFHQPGDLFGLAEHGRYVSEARTLAPSRVYRFPIGKLERLLLKHPRIQDGLLVKAMHDLRQAQRQVILMGRFDIPRRLAAFLVDCSTYEHYFDATKNTLTLPMSRYEIADYLGTSAETVTRALQRLEQTGMLQRLTARSLELKRDQLKAYVDFE